MTFFSNLNLDLKHVVRLFFAYVVKHNVHDVNYYNDTINNKQIIEKEKKKEPHSINISHDYRYYFHLINWLNTK
jgi:antitoxin component of RelBE/YafQ-DinJ toxin-antitoxin module